MDGFETRKPARERRTVLPPARGVAGGRPAMPGYGAGRAPGFPVGHRPLAERAIRYVTLLGPPDGHSVAAVRDASVDTAPPPRSKRPPAWRQGAKTAAREAFPCRRHPGSLCAPDSWRHGSGEYTCGPLRRYLPQGSDASRPSREELKAVVPDAIHGRAPR
ncbi:hypothetical protein SAMN02745673_01458 [Marinactinospora thermotolerans DSM 45154]|uniref:Uncharacterized protein n=1 Tax=Marinactinospora thermotolerans DSM 45154 TaxID=1122192 RepID=A0A1T4NHR5_9ACTN|nr:hypothetical protein SAMN02745673_01458 [Marinactinospora thermotolerans DSM 45154]